MPILLVFKCLNDLWSGSCGFGKWSPITPSVLTLAFETIFCLWVCVGEVTVQVQLQASSRKISVFSSKMDHQLVLSRSISHYSWASLFILPLSTGKSIWKFQLFISLFLEKMLLFFTDSPTSDFFCALRGTVPQYPHYQSSLRVTDVPVGHAREGQQGSLDRWSCHALGSTLSFDVGKGKKFCKLTLYFGSSESIVKVCFKMENVQFGSGAPHCRSLFIAVLSSPLLVSLYSLFSAGKSGWSVLVRVLYDVFQDTSKTQKIQNCLISCPRRFEDWTIDM